MYGGYGGNSKDSPSEKGGRFGGGGLGSPSKSASKSSSASKAGSTGSARSDTPSSNRAGLGTASKASKDTASKAAVGGGGQRSVSTGYDTGRFGGTTRSNNAKEVAANRSIGRAATGPATGFDLSGRTRMTGVDRPSTVPSTVPSQAKGFRSALAGQPPSMIDAPGLVSHPVSPTGFTPAGMKAVQPSALPDLATAPKAQFTASPGFRSPTTDVIDRVTASWAEVLGADNVRITGTPHGGLRTSAKGASSGRHGPTVGSALDYSVSVRGPDGNWTSLNFGNAKDKALADRVAVVGASKYGLKGYGAGQGYMSNAAIHHDVKANPRTGGFTWTGPAASIRGVPQSTVNALANARADYEAARKAGVPTAQQPVASIMASAADEDSAIAALNQMSGATRTAAVAPTVAAAGTADDFETRAPEMAGTTVPTPAADQSFPAAPTPPRNVLNLPTRAPKPTARDAPAYKRSGLGTVMAGGLDLLSSMGGVPSLVGQGLSYLTTGKSLGENVVDYVSQNENYFQPGEGTDRPGYGDAEQSTADYLAKRKKAAEKKAKAEEPTYDFVEKYIEFENTSGRPTPEQRWDWRSSKYIGVA